MIVIVITSKVILRTFFESVLCAKLPFIQVNVSTPESSLFDDKKKRKRERDTTQEWNFSSKNRQEYLLVTLGKQNGSTHILEKLVAGEKNGRMTKVWP